MPDWIPEPLRSSLRRLRYRVQSRVATAQRSRHGVGPEHVVWGYRLFLDREPENERVVREKLTWCRTTRDLRADFMTSAEFERSNADLAYDASPNVVIKELDGGLRLFVDLSDYLVGLPITRGAYERHETDFVARNVKRGDAAIDAGANIGYYTLRLAAIVGDEGHVFAFEPLASNAALLERSIIENHFTQRVTLERAALSDRAGVLSLVRGAHTINSGGAYLASSGEPVPADHVAVEVETLRLDDYRFDRPIRFVKLDIEGAEPLLVRGARELLSRDRPLILSEVHAEQLRRVSSSSPEAFVAEVVALGYECRLLEAGTPGRRFDGAGLSGSTSVVFVPR